MTRARNTADELSLITAKGDLLAGSASGVQSKLAVGSNNTVLTADSSTATGLKWGSVAATKNFTLINSGGTALTGAATVTYSGISGYDTLFVFIESASSVNAATIGIQVNGDTGGNYRNYGIFFINNSTWSTSVIDAMKQNSLSVIRIGATGTVSGTVSGAALLQGCNTSGAYKIFQASGSGESASNAYAFVNNGFWNSASTVTSISANSSSGNFDAGTMWIYGAA